MIGKNTIAKLNKNICFCLKLDKDIEITDCNIDCRKSKACSRKLNDDLRNDHGGVVV